MSARELRWNGWGYSDTTYSLHHRPHAWPYLREQLGLADDEHAPAVSLDAIQLRPSRLDASTLAQLRQIVGPEAVSTADRARIAHSLGKSYRDLIRLRAGRIPNPTDAVVFPGDEEEIERLLALATAQRLAIIPFGGGTSVVGGVEPRSERPTLTLSLARLNRIIEVEALSHTVTAEAGILGPDLERALNARGLMLGHFPQSFEFSTLGGWVATRGAGQASTQYGKIEDMVVGLRIATPRGVIETRNVPASAIGPSLLQLVVGSEGTYGVITRATLRLRPLPKFHQEHGLLFRDFHSGVAALRAIMQSGLTPSIARLSDEDETRLSFRLRERRTGWAGAKETLGLAALARAGGSFERGALLILRFEGNDECALHECGHALAICKERGAFDLGTGPTRSWERERYHTPYLRDVLLDHALMIDTLETATEWDNVETLHGKLNAAIAEAIAATGSKSLVLTHLSHVYRDGASLYVSFLARSARHQEEAQWQTIKDAATDCIMRNGGALSHHHGVGYEHARWMEQAEGEAGVTALRAIKRALDPQFIMNPSKLFDGA
jgi:alkyldihydroxyacetonephosphate synthase